MRGRFSGVLLASDVDGTLLTRDGAVPGRVREALQYFMDGGGLFTAATGRTRAAMARLRGVFPLNAPAILANGASAYDYQQDLTLFTLPLDGAYMDVARQVAERFPGTAVEVHSETAMWAFRPNRHTARHSELVGVHTTAVDDLTVPPRPWLKAVFVADPEILAGVRAFLEPVCEGRYALASSSGVFLELQHRDATKGEGVARVAAALGIAPERVYAVGDNHNDMPMITRFTGFAPQNARDEVKAAARAVVCSADDGAVADVIQWIEENDSWPV